jgi:hypothetical protein
MQCPIREVARHNHDHQDPWYEEIGCPKFIVVLYGERIRDVVVFQAILIRRF